MGYSPLLRKPRYLGRVWGPVVPRWPSYGSYALCFAAMRKFTQAVAIWLLRELRSISLQHNLSQGPLGNRVEKPSCENCSCSRLVELENYLDVDASLRTTWGAAMWGPQQVILPNPDIYISAIV